MRGWAILPKVPDDRSMTREHWKKAYSHCRLCSSLLEIHTPMLNAKVEQAYKDLLLYGVARIDIGEADLL